jgi:aerobic carbon-monoxide dehydrogenase medium subunit
MKGLFRPKEYFRPSTLSEALSLLSKYGEKARPVAGATNLFVSKPANIEYLVDITQLPLDYIKEEDDGVRIGALTTFRSIENSRLLRDQRLDVVIEASRKMGSVPIRNMATVGGNICKANTLTELCPVLMVLDARVRITGLSGERTLKLEEFFTGARKCALKNDELLTEVQIPSLPPSTGTAFLKVGRTTEDISIINVAVRVTLDSEERCAEVRIAVGGGAGPIFIRSKKAEESLTGKTIDAGLIREAARIVSEECNPSPKSIRGSPQYKIDLCKVLVERAFSLAIDRIGKGGA